MRYRAVLLTLSLYLAFALVGCSKPSTDSSPDTPTVPNPSDAGNPSPRATKKGEREAREGKERKEAKETKRAAIMVHSGTALTVSLGSTLGSKVSQSGQTFSGSVAKDVLVGDMVAIPQGAAVSGTVTDAKALGKFAGGAVLQVRLDSINLNGTDLPVQCTLKTFSEKGKGKRTAVMAGGGAALGGIIGGLAGGAALTGNQEITLPAESAVSFRIFATTRSETRSETIDKSSPRSRLLVTSRPVLEVTSTHISSRNRISPCSISRASKS